MINIKLMSPTAAADDDDDRDDRLEPLVTSTSDD